MYLCDCVYLAGLGEGGGGGGGGGGEGYRMGSCKPPMIPPSLSLSPPPLLPFPFSTLSPGSLELEVLNQAVAQRGGNLAYLCGILLFSTIWIVIAPTLLPSLFLLSTLSRKHRLSSHSLVRLCAALLPSLPRAASPLLITPINIFNFCHFSPCVLSSPLSVPFFSST